MTLEERFCGAVVAHLKALNQSFDLGLRRMVAKPFPAGTSFLQFEYEASHFAEDFTLAAWPMDATGDLNGDEYLFLEDGAVVVPPNVFYDEQYEGVGPWELASNLLEKWLSERWGNLKHVTLPAYVGHSDSFFKRDLSNGATISDSEIVARFESDLGP